MEPYLGQIMMFAGNFVIRGWAKCDGQLLPIAQNTALFSILGTMYGGDGRTTFGLPDFRGRVPMNWGQGPGLPNYTIGTKSGAYQHALTIGQLPVHHHAITPGCNTGVADSDTPQGNYPAVDEGATETYHSGSNGTMGSTNSANTGSGQTISLMQPYQVVTFLIALQGIFPSRN